MRVGFLVVINVLFLASTAFAHPKPIHKVRRGQGLWLIANAYGMTVKELKKINGIKSNLMHPGHKLKVKLKEFFVVASWYGKYFHGQVMANGEIFDMTKPSAAHKILPLGTIIEVFNPATKQNIKLTVTDRGPYIPGRSLDLSREAAIIIGMIELGVTKVRMRILSIN